MSEVDLGKLVLLLFGSGGFLYMIAQAWAVRTKAQATLILAEAELIRSRAITSESQSRALDVETLAWQAILDALKRSQENNARTIDALDVKGNLVQAVAIVKAQGELANQQITDLHDKLAPKNTPAQIAIAASTLAANIAEDKAASLPDESTPVV